MKGCPIKSGDEGDPVRRGGGEHASMKGRPIKSGDPRAVFGSPPYWKPR